MHPHAIFAVRNPAAVLTIAMLAMTAPLRAQCVDSAGAHRGAIARPRIAAARITRGAIDIDGRLDEPQWAAAPVAGPFIQQFPSAGTPASDSVVARVLYDDDAIYIGFRIRRRDPRTIAAPVARRDYQGYSDWAQVVIDGYHDRRTGWRLGVNPSGVQKDALEYDDGNGEDVGWDAVWDAAGHVDSVGWTAEMRIPFSQLRYASKAEAGDSSLVWGIDFFTNDVARSERDVWVLWPPDNSAFVSCFGELTGLRGLPSSRPLDIVPYMLGSDTRAPGAGANPFYRQDDVSSKVGADITYGLTSNLRLTAAINPDFGQVEADPSVVNLSAFETFFPEQRPLFLEGEEFFTFDMGFPLTLPGSGFANDEPFYSRRIGRDPEGTAPDSAIYADVPSSTRILGAAKLSGKTSAGWSLGFLDAVTDRATARYVAPSGQQLTAPVEPLTNYSVGRVIKDFDRGQSAVGAIVTATNRRLAGSALDQLRSGAYSAGVDGRHRFHRGAYELSASVLGTYLSGSRDAITAVQVAPGHWYQRPDAEYLRLDTTRTSLAGIAASTRIAKIGDGGWRWQLDGLARTPGFDVNDIGFDRSADWLAAGGRLGYVSFAPGRVVRDWNANVDATAGWSFGGELRGAGLAGSALVDFVNNWNVTANVTESFSALSIDALRGGPALRVPASTEENLQVTTDTRQAVSGVLSIDRVQEAETGGHHWTLSPSIDVRAGGRAEFSLGPSVTRLTNPWQYVTQVDAASVPHYLFGRLAQTTVSLVTRASYAFTPTLSLQLYGEPFVSAGDYTRYREVRDPRARRFDDRLPEFSADAVSYDQSTRTYHISSSGGDVAFTDPNFNIRQFRSTAVLRWEYHRGSTLYAVWSQGRSVFAPTGTLRLDRDVRELFGANATNSFEIKASYWLDW